jgi:hypothetical protein
MIKLWLVCVEVPGKDVYGELRPSEQGSTGVEPDKIWFV